MDNHTQSATRAGFIAILGAPNAGKSTLLNALVGGKVAITTPKAQTTRNAIRGIGMEGSSQLVFVDTPGIFDAKQRFERAMVATAWGGAADSDLMLLVTDVSRGVMVQTLEIANALRQRKAKVVLVLNKVDLVAKASLLAIIEEYAKDNSFERIFMVSAQDGDGLRDLKKYLAEAMPEGPHFYPPDQLADITEMLLASEITREKLFLQLDQELPYSLTVETEKFERRKDGSVKIDQAVYVQRDGQKKIVLGKQGARIKEVGSAARRELEAMWGCKVHLFLFVKVRENWKNNPESYRYLGLDYNA